MFRVKNCPAAASLLSGRTLAALAGLLSIHLLGAELRPGSTLPVLSEDSHVRTVVLATNLAEPIQLSVATDGRVVFGERRGAIKIWHPDTGSTATAGGLDVFTGTEDGLLGLTVDPGFATNGWIYVFHSTPGVLENRVSRFTIRDAHLESETQKILLRIPTLARKPNHSGGGLGFDANGNLYASTGDYTFINDSGGYSPLDERPGREVHDSQRTAANTLDLRGKILRIHPEPEGTYRIPPGNLFPPGTPGTLPEIYIMGCRNPFRFSVDARTGWLIWGDVGPDALEMNPDRGPAGFDEFNVARCAGNFGWPYFLADNRPYRHHDFATGQPGPAFDPGHPVNHSPNNTGLPELPPAQPAFLWYPPGLSSRFPHLGSGARSAMAGPIYRYDSGSTSARKFPEAYDGSLFLFEWERGWIRIVHLDAEARFQGIQPFLSQTTFKRPISMSFGPDGALYLIEWGTAWSDNRDARLLRVEYVP